MVIRFHPTGVDERLIAAFKREGETDSDVLRRGLRGLEELARVEQARAEAVRMALENRSLDAEV
jgi:Arc/MetJ-type ribon-helix-helix transcriptional regulator